MMEDMKIALLVIVALIISIVLSICFSKLTETTIDIEKQTPEYYVNDFANIFTDEQEQELISKAVELSDNLDGVKVVVSTIETLQEHSIERYSEDMFEQYELDKDDLNFLILFSKEEKEVIICRQQYMPFIPSNIFDGITYKYMDYIEANDYAQGIISIQSTLIDEIKERIPNNWREIYASKYKAQNDFLIGFGILFGGSILVVIYLVYYKDINEAINKLKKKK